MKLLLVFLFITATVIYGFVAKPTTERPGGGSPLFMKQDSTSRRDFVSKVAGATTVATQSKLWLPTSARATDSVAIPLNLPPMGLGAWAWGDSLFWGYDKKNDDELHRVFDYALEHSKPPVLFDTAELYGFGRSESLLGEFSKSTPDKVQIATKFAAFPFRTKPQDVVKACEASVKRLGGRPIDLYQIHFPGAWSNAEYWDGLAMAYEKGLVKAVGVSNYGVDATRACHSFLAERGIPLTSNQIQLSLLYRWPMENGLLDACRELNVKVLAYSPLALGFLTGKYTLDNLPSGPRKTIAEQLLNSDDYNNLLEVMRTVANKNDGATLSQVALNWTRAKQTIPIPGARSISQVQQNLGALDWTLSAQEEKLLDEAASKVTSFITPDKNPFPSKDKDTGLKMYDS